MAYLADMGVLRGVPLLDAPLQEVLRLRFRSETGMSDGQHKFRAISTWGSGCSDVKLQRCVVETVIGQQDNRHLNRVLRTREEMQGNLAHLLELLLPELHIPAGTCRRCSGHDYSTGLCSKAASAGRGAGTCMAADDWTAANVDQMNAKGVRKQKPTFPA